MSQSRELLLLCGGEVGHHPLWRISNNSDEQEGSGPGWCGYYSRPFLFLDMIWNLTFVVVSVVVLLNTFQEKPSTPLRLWLFGYALQCLLHAGFVWDEYQTTALHPFSFSALSHNSIIQKLESVHTILSSVWWVFGFYWTVLGGQPLLHDSPWLYWLSVIFLAFDVCFMIFCIIMACIVFFLLYCCFPILTSVAYAMTLRNGASESDIRSLPRYSYRQQGTVYETKDSTKQEASLTSLPRSTIPLAELVLHPEDSECCICLYKYTDGAELCTLPCNHHFHYKCITKWLRINATCPLCKFNILKGDMLV